MTSKEKVIYLIYKNLLSRMDEKDTFILGTAEDIYDELEKFCTDLTPKEDCKFTCTGCGRFVDSL